MSKANESFKTIAVAGALCFVCSIIVSSVVVTLRPQQAINADLDFKKNILSSAGLLKAGDDINTEFKKITPIIVDFETGKKSDAVDVNSFDQFTASKLAESSVKIPANIDVAALSTRAKFAKVYITDDGSMILYVRGKGLWSTMHGFIALAQDTKTIKGFAYYSQGETPGLGGEVDNPKWKSQWVGKELFDADFNVAFAVAKGPVNKASATAKHNVDGLSGATITANGVTTSMKYWFGDHAYGKFLANVRAGGI